MSSPATSPALERRSVRFPNKRHAPHRFLVQGVLEFLQLYFGALEGGDEFYYSDRPEESRVLIHDKGSFKLENVGQIPALVTHRKDVHWGGQGGVNKLKQFDLRTGEKHFHGMESGAVVVHAIAEDSMTSDELGGIVYRFFTELHDYSRKLGFFKIQSSSISEEQKIQVGAEDLRVVVSVTIVASWQRAWATRENAPSQLARVLMTVQES